MKSFMMLLGLITILGLTGCQKKDDGGGNNVPPPAQPCPANYVMNAANQCVYNGGVGGVGSCQGSCPAGQIQTAQYGCLPQNTCRSCYGYIDTAYGGMPSQGWCMPSNVPGANFSFKANAYNPE